MTWKNTFSRSPKSIARAALAGLELLVLLGGLHGPATELTCLLGTAATQALGLLPSFLPVAGQALLSYAADHQCSSPWPLPTVVSFWPMLHAIAELA